MRSFQFFILFLFIPALSSAQTTITQLGHLAYNDDLSNLWGWADTSGHEYALVGTHDGTSIVDVTDPANPVQVRFVNGPNSDWREIKTWGHYAYVVTEGGGGLQIINLSTLPGPVAVVSRTPQGLGSAHTLFIDENGMGYICGSNIYNEGAIFMDIAANPSNPPIVGAYDERYVHDCFVRGDTMYSAEVYEGEFSVIDVSNKANPVVLETQATSSHFTHNMWMKPGGNILLTTDERSGAFVDAYDVSDVNNIERLGLFQSMPGTGVIPHNVYWHDNGLAVASYYTAGIVVLDPTYPSQMVQVGNFDTSPLSGNGFDGCWGVYPYLPSGNIIASDIQEGLFVLGVNYLKASYIEGTVTDACTGDTLQGVSVQINGSNRSAVTDADGHYVIVLPDSGLFNVTWFQAGLVILNDSVQFVNGVTANGNVQLNPLVPAPVAAFTQTDTDVCMGESITFTDLSQGQCLARQWSFDGGQATSLTDSIVQATFLPGTRMVQLITTTTGGSDTADATVTVHYGPQLTAIAFTDATCQGATDGSAQVIPGDTTDTVLWSNGETGFQIDSLGAGAYSFTLINLQGCTMRDSITIQSGPGLAIDITTTDETAPGTEDGTALVTVIMGMPPYTYKWSADTTWFGPGLTGLAPGTYTVTVSMNVQCQVVDSFTIDSMPVGIDAPLLPAQYLYPNPFVESFTFAIPDGLPPADICIYSSEGKLLFSQKQVAAPMVWGYAVETGIYFVNIQQTGEPVKYFKLIKLQH